MSREVNGKSQSVCRCGLCVWSLYFLPGPAALHPLVRGATLPLLGIIYSVTPSSCMSVCWKWMDGCVTGWRSWLGECLCPRAASWNSFAFYPNVKGKCYFSWICRRTRNPVRCRICAFDLVSVCVSGSCLVHRHPMHCKGNKAMRLSHMPV